MGNRTQNETAENQRRGTGHSWRSRVITRQSSAHHLGGDIACFSLGERYLWVDSFCILQDDWNDATENIKSMALIYGRAIFTICAALGDHSDAGLLGYFLNSGKLVHHIELVGGLELMAVRTVDAHIQRSPWNSRSWTLEERLLSKRCLLFAEGRVLFQCRRAVWSEENHAESGPETWTLDFVGLLLSLLNENPLKRYCSTLRSRRQVECLCWHRREPLNANVCRYPLWSSNLVL